MSSEVTPRRVSPWSSRLMTNQSSLQVSTQRSASGPLRIACKAAFIWDTPAGSGTSPGRPMGRQIASAGSDGTVKLWDIKPNRDFTKVPLVAPNCIAFAQDGQMLVTLDAPDPWYITSWDVHSGSLVKRNPIGLSRPTNTRRWTAFSPDGQRLVFVNQDGSVTLWNTATCRKEKRIYSYPWSRQITRCSQDGRYVLIRTGSKSISVGPGEPALDSCSLEDIRERPFRGCR